MDKYFESNNKIFCECVTRWEKQDSKKIRSLYIKDLNIARTLLLWIYPPFIEEFTLLNKSEPRDGSVEVNTFPGFGKDNYATQVSDWTSEKKKFLSRWNVKMRPESALTFSNLHKMIYPILFAKKASPEGIKFLPFSDFPSPVRALSKGQERTLSRSEDPIPFRPYEITLTIDARWPTNDITKEISKYVADYQQLYCERVKARRTELSEDEILVNLQKTLHPMVKTCPQENYYDYFYKYSFEKKGFSEIAKSHNLNGQGARSTVSKAIDWVVEFLDYDVDRGNDWIKRHLKDN